METESVTKVMYPRTEECQWSMAAIIDYKSAKKDWSLDLLEGGKLCCHLDLWTCSFHIKERITFVL